LNSSMRLKNTICFLCLLLAVSACTPAPQSTPIDPITETPESPASTVTQVAVLTTETPADPTETPAVATDQGPETPVPTAIVARTTFSETFGGIRRDRGINLLQTNDGGYAIVGYTASQGAGQEDVFLVRTDPHGQLLWSNTYGGAGTDNGWAVLETEDGGFLITGFTNSFGAGQMDFYLVRTDAAGDMLWERTFGGPENDYGWAMAPTPDGGYALAGQTTSFGAGLEDGYLVKVNAQGEEIWSQTFGGSQEDRLFSIDQGVGGGYILTGTTRSYGAADSANRDLYLVKTADSGEVIWTQVLGENLDDVGHAVRQTSDGGYVVTGYSRSFGAQNYDTWLIKTDEAGISQWERFYGGPGDDRTIFGEQTDDGGFILIGYTKSFDAAGWDLFLVRADSSGEVTWHKTFGGPAEDTGYTVRQTSDGGFVLTGETYSLGEGGGDMYVIKVDDSGELSEHGQSP
jgi:hypothetical protein